MASSRSSGLGLSTRLMLWAAGFVLAFVLCVWWGANQGVHNDFTQNAWLPAKLVLNGADPYNPSRSQVDAALGEYSSAFTGFNSGRDYHFIYPIWVALLFTPLAALPLTLSLALWRATNLLLLVWSAASAVRSSNPAFRAMRSQALAGVGLIVLLSVIFRGSVLNLAVGQFGLIELGLLVAIWGWLISSEGLGDRRRLWGDALCGVALAVLATKPQAVALGLVLIGLWAVSRRRWIMPASATASLAVLMLGPNLFYGWSLKEWLANVFSSGQASSQAKVSASVWGASYELFGGASPWVILALALSIAGIAVLLPYWWRDLRDKFSPVPLSLPLTLCVTSMISPYLLGYEHAVLLLPALVLLAAAGPAGVPGEDESREHRLLRLSVFGWLAILPWLIVAVQGFIDKEYIEFLQSAALLGMCWFVKLRWVRG